MKSDNSSMWKWTLAGLSVAAVVGGARGCGQHSGVLLSSAQLGVLPVAATAVPTATPTIVAPTTKPTPPIVTAPRAERHATPVPPSTRASAEGATPAPPPTPTPTVVARPTEVAEASRTYLVIDAGIAFGFASVSPSVDNSCCSVGPSVGVGLEKELDRTFSLWPSIRYVKKGGRALIGGSQVEVNLEYLELPLLVKARWQEGRLHPFVFAGPNVGINIGAKGVAYGVTRNLKPGISAIDVSVDAGVGVDYVLDDRLSLSLSNRFSFGFTDVDRGADTWRSRSFQVQGGVRISLP